MLLSPSELARIEAMVEEGRICDEPGALSCTEAALRKLGYADGEGTSAGTRVRRPKSSQSPGRDLSRAGQSSEVNWLDLPDLDSLIALRRRIVLGADGS
ncbi:hypothetical protein CA233_01810 [Sphingomonas sp. ABOLD]|uniref:hypothetical protein n=1 Tax=unclassified Sphingomonas TaxID=196159 RepID=UPI000F7F284B|nr:MULTISPECIES: hypothetical protein [unclassified Sphingomonas]RSV39701.1 hypothetical protein CA234_14035 [Sphingomonas sp. ABOLE]RSV52437.1 hypothetical protein CA233_01810 [Sphingomonas sp. ABOLD]